MIQRGNCKGTHFSRNLNQETSKKETEDKEMDLEEKELWCMDNQTVITARDIKEILKSLKSDEELVIGDEGIKIIKKED